MMAANARRAAEVLYPRSSKVPAASPADWPQQPESAAFMGLAGRMVETLNPHTEADPVAVLVQFLIAFGNAVGRNPYFQVESDRHFLNENAVLVGATAKGRKGTSWGHVRRVFSQADDQWENQRIATGLSSGEGLIWAVRDPIEQTQAIKEKGRTVGYEPVQSDAGISDKRLLVVESEFSSPLRVMAREGNTLSAVIRNSWDTGGLRILTKNAPAAATGAHVSIIGHVTREELRRHLNETEMANGFANRFLWACSRRSKMLPDGGAVDDVIMFELGRSLEAALISARRIGRMKRDEQAAELWGSVYPDLSEGGTGLLGAITSRGEAHVMRLACIYAALDASETIRLEHLRAALALWTYCAESCRHIFGDNLGNTTADVILAALQDRPAGMTRTEIRDLFQRHRSRAELDSALAELQRRNLVCRQDEATGGHPAERWFAAVAKVASVATASRDLSTHRDAERDCDESDIGAASPPRRVAECQS